jgi:hypothetical protein
MCLLTAWPLAAQESNKPGIGSFLLETGFSPFSSDGSIQLQEGQVRGVYMTSDNVGLRFGIGFMSESASSDNGLSGDDWAKSSESASELTFSGGLMRFLPGSEKLSPYIGFEAFIATASNRVTQEAKDYKMVMRNADSPLNCYGANLFSGFNYYFAKTIYFGAEINLSLKSYSVKQSKTETTIDGSKETLEPVKDKFRTGSFGLSCNPYIRLGWAF